MRDREQFLVVLKAVEEGRIQAGRLVESASSWIGESHGGLAEYVLQSGWISAVDWSSIETSLRSQHILPVPDDRESDEMVTVDHRSSRDVFQQNLSAISRLVSPEDDSFLDSLPPSPFEPESRGFGQRYQDVEEHATGGPCIVYRAWDRALNRQVAIKALRESLVKNVEYVRRFRQEAQITAGLAHPNIVAVYETASEWSEIPYYTMPLLSDRSFREEIQEHHQSPLEQRFSGRGFTKLIDAFLMICDAIHYAHSAKRIIHRDIKARNIVLGPYGEVIMLDWGLAKGLDDPDDILGHDRVDLSRRSDVSMASTIPGHPIGTLHCMPPEQARGDHEQINERSDVFGLGALLYHILTGAFPYATEGRTALLEMARRCEPAEPSQILAGVSPALESICKRAMAKEPLLRYATAAELAEEVRRWRDDEPVQAHPESAASRLARWSRKHQTVVAGTFAILLTALIASGIGTYLVRQESERADAEKVTAQKASIAALQSAAESDRSAKAARKALSSTLSAFGEFLGNVPRSERFRAQITKQAVDYSYAMLADRPQDPAALYDMAINLLQSANANRLLLEHKAASQQYDRAVEILEGIVRDASPDSVYRIQLAWTIVDRGILSQMMGRDEAGIQEFQKAMDIALPLIERNVQPDLARYVITRAYLNRGVCHRELQHLDLAEADYRTASEQLQKALTANSGAAPDMKFSLDVLQILIENGLAETLAMQGKTDEALAASARAQGFVQELNRGLTVLDNNRLFLLADTRYRQGLAQMGQPEMLAEAVASLDASVADLEVLAEEFLALPTYRENLANALRERGRARRSLARLRQEPASAWLAGLAESDWNRAEEIDMQLAREFPESATYPRDLETLRKLREPSTGPHARAVPAF